MSDIEESLFRMRNGELYIGIGDRTVMKVAKEIGLSRAHAFYLVDAWLKAGLIAHEGRGRYIYTAIGLELRMIVEDLRLSLKELEAVSRR